MERRVEGSQPPMKALADDSWFVKSNDESGEGTSRWMRWSVLFLVGISFFLVGFFLVILGSGSPASFGGCFFWPIPVIVVCGLGAGSGAFLLVGVFASVLMFLLVFLGWWSRRPGAESSSVSE